MQKYDVYKCNFIFEEDRIVNDNPRSKIRPSLVVYVDDENPYVEAAMITSNKRLKSDYEIRDWKQAGLDKPSYIRFSNYYPMNKNQLLTYVGHLSDYDIQKIKSMRLTENTIKTKSGKWVNKGDSGETHGNFKTKKAADAQRKAMFANGYHEDLDRKAYDYRDVVEEYLYVKYEIVSNHIVFDHYDYVIVDAVNTGDYSIFILTLSEEGKRCWPYNERNILIGISEHNSVTWNKWSNWYNFDEYTNNKDIHQSNGCTIIKFGEFDKRSECYSASGKAISGQLDIDGDNHSINVADLPEVEFDDIEEDLNNDITKAPFYKEYVEWENYWNDKGYKTDSYDKDGVYIPVIDPWTGYEIWNSDWKDEWDEL